MNCILALRREAGVDAEKVAAGVWLDCEPSAGFASTYSDRFPSSIVAAGVTGSSGGCGERARIVDNSTSMLGRFQQGQEGRMAMPPTWIWMASFYRGRRKQVGRVLQVSSYGQILPRLLRSVEVHTVACLALKFGERSPPEVFGCSPTPRSDG